MKLSSQTVQKLADAIAHDVFKVMETDGRYLDGVMNSIEPSIVAVLGKISPELVGQLGPLIMEKITVLQSNNPYDDNNIWKVRYQALYKYVKQNYAESYIDGAEYQPTMYGNFEETAELD